MELEIFVPAGCLPYQLYHLQKHFDVFLEQHSQEPFIYMLHCIHSYITSHGNEHLLPEKLVLLYSFITHMTS